MVSIHRLWKSPPYHLNVLLTKVKARLKRSDIMKDIKTFGRIRIDKPNSTYQQSIDRGVDIVMYGHSHKTPKRRAALESTFLLAVHSSFRDEPRF